MRFRFDSGDRPGRLVSVDGVLPEGPNFSHWPGNRTPPELKADTTTEIALCLAALGPSERLRLLDGLDVVANNHFDTDGVLSCFTVMNPDLALRHRDLLIAAALTGDFQVFTTDAALAIELTITKLGDDEGPHGAEIAKLEGVARGQRQYEVALAAVPALLADPFAFRELIEGELRAELDDLRFAREHAAVTAFDDAQLAVVTAPRELRRLAVNSVAGPRWRVLAVAPANGGNLFRHHERVESWFEMVSIPPVRRFPLEPLASRLNELESPDGEARWIAQSIEAPVPEVFFGVEGSGRSFGSTTPGDLRPSRLEPSVVVATIRDSVTVAAASGRCP